MEYLSIIITILASIITLYSIVLAYRSKKIIKRPCKIKYYPCDTLNIFNLSNQFGKFKIMYDDTYIDKSLIYISGKFICEGQDISTKGNKIKLELIDKSNWIDLSVKKSNDEIVSDIKRSDTESNIAYLYFDNLRQNEFLGINALIKPNQNQAEDAILFQNNIKLTHRIDNTDIFAEPIKKSLDLKESLSIIGMLLMLVGMGICIPVFLLFIPMFFDATPVLKVISWVCPILSFYFVYFICREILNKYKNHL